MDCELPAPTSSSLKTWHSCGPSWSARELRDRGYSPLAREPVFAVALLAKSSMSSATTAGRTSIPFSRDLPQTSHSVHLHHRQIAICRRNAHVSSGAEDGFR